MKKLLFALLGLFLILGVASYFLSRIPEVLFPDDYSTVVLDRKGDILRVFLNKSEQWCFTPDPEVAVPDKLIKAALLFEDKRFYQHSGVDIYSIIRAIMQNVSSGKRVSGASTISMQVIRLSSRQNRTFFNKFREALQALRLERRYSKSQILHMYFNHAPYGGNIIGYRAASWRYFGKPAKELTWAQAASLAIIPNAPSLWNTEAGRKKLVTKRDRLLKRLHDSRTIDHSTYKLALTESLGKTQKSFPFRAPHFALHVRSKHPGCTTRTTLDPTLQKNTEEAVRDFILRIKDTGIYNAAVLVSENPSGKIRAYAGSQDFFDETHQGQVDGILSARSSGSILKPFLYALCMDRGMICPRTLLKDVPTYFGAYSPANYDSTYCGIIPAKEALIRSLNVPAVRLLARNGVEEFYDFLKSAGVSTLFRKPDEYGLTLILGGAETTLMDLGALYSGLASEGRFKPLRYLDKEASDKTSLISPGACSIILECLKEVKRPGAEYYWHKFQNKFPLAWKTGTSFGYRDAWAAGVNPEWTIAVWVGNFDGQGNSELTGSKAAGPLLFNIFGLLPKNPSRFWFDKPDMDFKTEKICQSTGYRQSENCAESSLEKIPAETNLQPCPYHRTLSFNRAMTHEVCSCCWDPSDWMQKKVLQYPADVVQYLKESGQNLYTALPHNASCTAQPENSTIEFIYPINGSQIVLPRDLDGNFQKIVVRLASRTQNNRVFWYLDNEFIRETSDDHSFSHSFSRGSHMLLAIDESGNQKKIRFSIDRADVQR